MNETTVTRLTNQKAPPQPTRGVRLRMVHGEPRRTEVIDVPLAGIVLGASDGADVRIEDKTVSRRHASLSPAADGWVVADLGSRNGTWLDGVRVEKAAVRAGSVIRLGDALLEFLPGETVFNLPPSETSGFGQLRGSSLAMRRAYAVLERVCRSDAPVLLRGESGTGKELAARALHEQGPRRDGPFIVFDCGAASDTLIESELFGYKRGAFTGAQGDRQGAFAAAHGGTLFLDEIGDLPLALQPQLLRLLERSEVIPLGSQRAERYDVRFCAATHKDLEKAVLEGDFRADLYYRLAVVELVMPPLRQRLEDLADLIGGMLEGLGLRVGLPEGPVLASLQAYAWPGNVRELRNVVARAAALAPPGSSPSGWPWLLGPGGAPPEQAGLGELSRADRPFHEAKEALLARFEREYVTSLLEKASGNLSSAARIAEIDRKSLYALLDRTGMRASKSE